MLENDKKLLSQKVSPFGVISVVVLSGIVAWLLWIYFAGARNLRMEPPFTKSTLAEAVVLAIQTFDRDQYELTLLDPYEIELVIREAMADAGDQKREHLEQGLSEVKRKWGPPFHGEVHSFERVAADVKNDKPKGLDLVDFETGPRDVDFYSGLSSYSPFTIHCTSGAVDYTVVVDELCETGDGWKIAGRMKVTKEINDPYAHIE